MCDNPKEIKGKSDAHSYIRREEIFYIKCMCACRDKRKRERETYRQAERKQEIGEMERQTGGERERQREGFMKRVTVV